MKINSDNILIRNLAGGDITAMDVLYIRYAPQVKAFLGKAVSGLRSEDIEDLTHDIFIRIWESRSSLREGESLSAYIFTLAKNAALNEIKHSKVADRYSQWHKVFRGGQVSESDPEREFEAKDALLKTRAAIDDLDERQKSIFLANRLEKKTYREIARELNLSPRTIQYHISEVLSKLRSKL